MDFETIFYIVGLVLLFIFNIKMRKHEELKKDEKRKEDRMRNEEAQNIANKHSGDIINEIIRLITVEKKRDVKEIAELIECSTECCISKINYLDLNQMIPNIHLNYKTMELIECTQEDEELLTKYTSHINNKNLDAAILNENNFNEVLHLYKLGLIPEIEIDEKTGKIIYLTYAKKMHSRDLITIRCNKCGASNEVNRHGTSRCKYCNELITDENK